MNTNNLMLVSNYLESKNLTDDQIIALSDRRPNLPEINTQHMGRTGIETVGGHPFTTYQVVILDYWYQLSRMEELN